MNREAERIASLRDAVFLKGCIPRWHAAAGYAAFGALAVIVIPFLYHPVRWCATGSPPRPLTPTSQPSAVAKVRRPGAVPRAHPLQRQRLQCDN